MALLFLCPSSYASTGELLHPLQTARHGWKPSPPWQIHGQGMSASNRQGMGEQSCARASASKSLWGEDQVPDHAVFVTRLQCFKNRSWSVQKLDQLGLGGEKEPQLLSPKLSKLHLCIFWKVYEHPHIPMPGGATLTLSRLSNRKSSS